MSASFLVAVVLFFVPFTYQAQAQLFCQEGECRQRCDSDEREVGRCNGGVDRCCKVVVQQEEIVSTGIDNPLAFDTVEGLLDSILSTLQAIIAVISLIFVVLGGILYITAAGDEGKVEKAKGSITAALVGLALAVGAPSFLKQIGEVLGWGDIDSGPVGGALTLAQIATNVLNFLLSTVGVLAIIMMVFGGLMYLLAAGDESRIETGKSIVKYSIIGVAVTLGALVLVNQVASFFAA